MTDSFPTCNNCQSIDLGQFLCRNCFQNLYELDNVASVNSFMNELTVLIPELDQINQAKTVQEVDQLAEELEKQLNSRLSSLQLERLNLLNSQVQQVFIEDLRSRQEAQLSSNVLGLVFVFFVLLGSIWSVFALPAMLAILIPLGLIVYLSSFVFCNRCRKFLFKRKAFLKKTVLGERYGTHTEHQEVSSFVQNYDNRGKMSGFSSASTYIPYNVEHVDETGEYVYGCHYCGNVFGKVITKRFNVS